MDTRPIQLIRKRKQSNDRRCGEKRDYFGSKLVSFFVKIMLSKHYCFYHSFSALVPHTQKKIANEFHRAILLWYYLAKHPNTAIQHGELKGIQVAPSVIGGSILGSIIGKELVLRLPSDALTKMTAPHAFIRWEVPPLSVNKIICPGNHK